MTQGTTAFERRHGFARKDVTLGNWRTRPYNGWALQNVSEIVPCAQVSPASTVERPVDASALLAQTIDTGNGAETIASFLQRSDTDCLTVMKNGVFVADYAAPTCDPSAPHLVFSIGKSLTALLAGTLVDQGLLDPGLPVETYLPEADGSAYGGECTVQHVFDMRVSLDFEESYLDPQSAFARYRRAMLWNPGARDETLSQFVLSLQKGAGSHGGPFRYQSPNSDLLGMIVERVSGERYADLLRERVWKPSGCVGRCLVAVDAEGTARGAGGVSITARDLARIGEMMRNGGIGPGGRALSEGWVKDTTTGGDQAAWLAGDFPHLFANGRYRNKWYQTGFDSGAFMAIGIHGQWLYVDPSKEAVIVKLSSQAEPVDDPLDHQCLDFFHAVAGML